MTWRGIPIILSDKVPVEKGKTKFILVRTGVERQGVVGPSSLELEGQSQTPAWRCALGSTVPASRRTSSRQATSLVALTDDARGAPTTSRVDNFHDYS